MQWEESIVGLVKAGIKGATLANNHMTDFGGEGVAHTRKILKDNGIDVIGLTSGKKSPYGRQVMLKVNGNKIIIFVFDLIIKIKIYRVLAPIKKKL